MVSVVKPGSFALVSLVFGSYVNRILFLALKKDDTTPIWTNKLSALVCIWAVIGLTACGSQWSILVVNYFTLIKLNALLLISIIGLFVLCAP